MPTKYLRVAEVGAVVCLGEAPSIPSETQSVPLGVEIKVYRDCIREKTPMPLVLF